MPDRPGPCCFKTVAPLILASASPRRRVMLAKLGLDFTIDAAQADERVRTGERAADFVLRVARDKAAIVAGRHPGAWTLAADTAVVLQGEILGKPAHPPEARRMLSRLAGRTHEVWTGFCLTSPRRPEQTHSQAVRTEVRFSPLTPAMINAYVRTGDPLDKAGAYGIQSLAGFMVEEISGSYSNVVGLPLSEVIARLLALDLIVPVAPDPS